MLWCILSGFALALVTPLLHRYLGRLTGWGLAFYCGTLCAYFARQVPRSAAGDVLIESIPWAPQLGVALSFSLDGLSLLFSLLITGIGAVIFLYAGAYLRGNPQQGRLFAFLLMFMASMLGVVLADDILLLFVFWELTSFSSYLLIGFRHSQAGSRTAALQALLITGAGGLALLAAGVLLGQATGTFTISELLLQKDSVQQHTHYPAILALVCLAGFTKSAQFPFHTWLPQAMVAPTPVSAYLHSATMVKAGVYLFARLYPVLGDSALWAGALGSVGLVTMVAGAALSLGQYDLKRILAYATISVLGALVMLIGIGGKYAIAAMVTLLVVHSLYKGALFLVAGNIDHEAGTRDVRELGGLWRAMPVTALAAALAAASMAGFPPFIGFLSKELLYEATWHLDGYALLFTTGAVLANALLLAVAAIVAIEPFFGAPRSSKKPHEVPFAMWIGPAMLASIGILAGFALGFAGEALLTPAAATIAGPTAAVKLAYWHGVNLILALSGFTMLLGLALFLARRRLRNLRTILDPCAALGPQRWYELALQAVLIVARVQTRLLQNGVLGLYLVTIVVTFMALCAWPLARASAEVDWEGWQSAELFSLMIATLIVAVAALAVTTNSRLTAVAAMGGIGYGVSIIFLLYGAPDLAMTQFAIETLTVVVFLLAIQRLPPFKILSTFPQRVRDAIVAATAGAVMSSLVLLATNEPLVSKLAKFYGAESYPAAHGRNVVNVILVDFRGLDTLGEITVLSVAAIGVYALMRLRLEKGETP